MKRYYYLLKNASSPATQRKILALAAKRGLTSITIRMLFAYAYMALFTGLVAVWNWLMFPEEWERLRRAQTRGLQLIVSSDKETGKVVTLPIVGALFDAIDFFGLPDILSDDLALIFTGEAPMKGAVGAAKQLAIAPFNRITQSLNPFLKSAFELGTGQIFYPDIRNPRPIYDYSEYFSTFLSVQDEYRALTGVPTRSPYFFGHIRNLFVRDLDPDELSYYMAGRIVEEYKGERFSTQPANKQAREKKRALYLYATAVRFGKTDEALEYLNQYYSLGGTPKSLGASLRGRSPLNGLDKYEKDDVRHLVGDPNWKPDPSIRQLTEFGKSLTTKELNVFRDALNYYARTYDPNVAPRTLNP